MAGKKFYAIARGRVPGVYDNWPLAHAQVTGFPGARYKGFVTRGEAETWLKEAPSPSSHRRPKAATVRTAPIAAASRPGAIMVYTDGGARFNPGPGGYGVIIIEDGHPRELSGGYRHTTNNRMELMGCIVALTNLADHLHKPVVVHTDSQYVVNGINKGWASSWRKRGWLKADRQPALNADLWGRLLNLIEGHEVSFQWVRGHVGHPENERCDQLAVASSARSGLPIDEGYEVKT